MCPYSICAVKFSDFNASRFVAQGGYQSGGPPFSVVFNRMINADDGRWIFVLIFAFL
jgi:hypothetical protein